MQDGEIVSKSIREWQKEIHKLSREKGWWDDPNRNVGEVLSLFHSEISEALEEYRTNHGPDIDYYFKVGSEHNPNKPEGFWIEIADLLIRVFDFAEKYDVDLESLIDLKHEFNKSRPYRHGGKSA